MAMLLGTLLVALGVHFYSRRCLLTGSTAGMAFLVQYATGWRLSVIGALVLNLIVALNPSPGAIWASAKRVSTKGLQLRQYVVKN